MKAGLFGGAWEDYLDGLNEAFDRHAPDVSGMCDAIPETVREYLGANSGWSLLTDMRNEDDQKDWDQRHPALCPGIAEGNF